MRVGLGYDIHPLVAGRKFFLAGVAVAFEKGPSGHSDGDPLSHALADALLGAAGLDDIGCLFPDTDPAYRDMPGLKLLREVVGYLSGKGFSARQVDTVVICQRPRLTGLRREIKRNLAVALNIPLERVGLKFKTNEGLGPLGRGEALAAQAVVLVDQR